MTMIKNISGQFPPRLQGTIAFTGSVTGAYVVGETVTGSGGFSAVVCKYNATAKTILVKKIVGTPTGTITGYTSGATATVDTTTQTNVGGVLVNTGGWNLRETTHGITRSKTVGSRTLVEVLIAQNQMSVLRTDFGTAATFTLTGGAWSSATTYDVSNGDVVTFTIISSEPVRLPTGTTYTFTQVGGAGAGIKTASLSSNSQDGLTHTFSFPVTETEIGGTSFTITTDNLNLNGGTAFEIADDGTSQPLTGTLSVGGSLASKTGVTIQA